MCSSLRSVRNTSLASAVGLAVVCSILACADSGLRTLAGALESAPVNFGSVAVGETSRQKLKIRSAGAGSLRVNQVTCDNPELLFNAEALLGTLESSKTRAVDVTWSPAAPHALFATFLFDTDAGPYTVEVTGNATISCPQQHPCLLNAWDEEASACVERPQQGACDDGNACTTADQCFEGACVGTPRTCNDSDVCTIDSCDPELGCVTEIAPECALACPPDDVAPGSAFSGRSFEEMWGSSSDDLWAVGVSGTALHYDGAAWRTINTCTDAWLMSVSGTSENDVWAVGDAGTVLHWDGVSFTQEQVPTTERLWGVFALSPTDVWAVGGNGVSLHRNAEGWTLVPTGVSGKILYSVWGGSANNVWAVGAGGTIRRWTGSSWVSVTSPTNVNLFSVRGLGTSVQWAVGAGGALLRYSGSSWIESDSGTETSLYSVWGTSANDYWVSGLDGVARHHSSGGWSNANSPVAAKLYALWGTDLNSIWLAGTDGTFLKRQASSWVQQGP